MVYLSFAISQFLVLIQIMIFLFLGIMVIFDFILDIVTIMLGDQVLAGLSFSVGHGSKQFFFRVFELLFFCVAFLGLFGLPCCVAIAIQVGSMVSQGQIHDASLDRQ